MRQKEQWSVVDLFYGAGGMSYGFHAHKKFSLLHAADAQIGKPSSGVGSLDCNATYKLNIGITPLEVDLSAVSPTELFESCGRIQPTVLIACSPCTGFSRTLSANHLADDPRNSLVTKTAKFVEVFKPAIFLMENARELIRGNHKHHFAILREDLEHQGYEVSGQCHFLNRFGLPQRRERAIVVAVRQPLQCRTLGELWRDYRISEEATTVRRAIADLAEISAGEADPVDEFHASPGFTKPIKKRLNAVPHDGGSWAGLRHLPNADELLTPAMKRYIAQGKLGSHPDVYGRMSWDRPAPTIKRECAHIGNGRYAHPIQDRLCTVREMAILQGFPSDFRFTNASLANMYRHIGDAVPPLISYQIAHLCEWILNGKKPRSSSLILKNTHLHKSDIERNAGQQLLAFATS